MATTDVLSGRIKRIVDAQGYGFISHAATGEDYFFHASELIEDEDGGPPPVFDEALVGRRVCFEPTPNPKGPRALLVRLLATPPRPVLPPEPEPTAEPAPPTPRSERGGAWRHR